MAKEQIWNFWAPGYEKLWVQKYSLQPTRKKVLNTLKGLLKAERNYKILDIGCGTGQLLRDMQRDLAQYQLELTGLDFSSEMINLAQGSSQDIKYIQMDVQELGALGEKFDIIICTHSFPYYRDQRKVLEYFRYLINPKGYILLAQASANSLYDRVALFFVKFTTGRATYPSIKTMQEMSQGLFNLEQVLEIKEKFYMPAIYLFVLKGNEENHEYFTD